MAVPFLRSAGAALALLAGAGCAAPPPEAPRPAPFAVFDNLYYLGTAGAAAWLLATDQGLVLINAPPGDAAEGVRALGFEPEAIRYLLVSDAGRENAGGVRRMQDRFGPAVMMTEEDWRLALAHPDYPPPVRHLSVAGGDTLDLGRARLRFMHTPGRTPGGLSVLFTVYDGGYPRTAFLFGGAGPGGGPDAARRRIDSIRRVRRIPGVEVHVPNRPGEVVERAARLRVRRPGEPHPFVDPAGWTAWLDAQRERAEAELEGADR